MVALDLLPDNLRRRVVGHLYKTSLNIRFFRSHTRIADSTSLLMDRGSHLILARHVTIREFGRVVLMHNAVAQIGVDTTIDPACEVVVDNDAALYIGYNTFIGRNVNIRTNRTIRIGNDVRVAQMVSLVGGQYSYHDRSQLICKQPFKAEDVNIGNDVWLGVGVVVLPGVSIGDGAVVGAGTVVTHDVEPYSVVVGNPQRMIGNRN